MIWTIFEHSFLVTCGMLYGMYAGGRSGRALEKARCVSLCAQSFNEGISPTARRIYHSIFSDRETIISEEEFFGP